MSFKTEGRQEAAVAVSEAIETVFGILWPQQDWNGEEGFCRAVAEKVVRTLALIAPAKPAVEVVEALPTELWALCYLHDWDPPKEGQEHRWEPGKNVFPEVHAFYRTRQEAEAIRRDMGGPEKYWTVRMRPENEARALAALQAPATPDAQMEVEK